MGAFNNIKHAFLLKAFTSIEDLIIQKCSVNLSSPLPFEQFSVLPFLKIGLFINLT